MLRFSIGSPGSRLMAENELMGMSSPTSLIRVWATITSMPSMRVRSTPVTRCSSLRSSNRGAFLAGFVFFLLGSSSVGWRGIIFCESPQVLLQLLIALSDPLLVGVVHRYFLLQYKYQFRTPVAL